MNRREFSQMIVGAAVGHGFLSYALESNPSKVGLQFSVMLWTIDKQRGVERSIEIVADAGYHGVELVSEFETWSAQDTRRIMAKMNSLGLIFDTIDGGSYTLADPAATQTILKKLAVRMDVAKGLGCSQLILTSGNSMKNLSQQAQRSAVIETLKHVAELASKNNMQIVIEPIDPFERPDGYLTSVIQGFEIVHAVNSQNVKVLYDFYHEQQAGGNLIVKLEQNIQWVGLVHVADVPGRHEPGTGEIDYGSIYRKLAELGYNKFIAMEFYPTGDPLQLLKKARLDALKAARGNSAV
ncbi:MAG: TIM barrel protein [Acidobacteriaceae bacterium]